MNARIVAPHLVAMGILASTGELFQLNINAKHLLDPLGFDFFNSV